MARLLSARDRVRLSRLAQPHPDRRMAPEAMSRYLTYRLHLVEIEIDGIVQDLGRSAVLPFPAALDDDSLPENVWTSWTSLHYLLQARENLKVALSRSDQAPH
jgi:hypothetical protein